MVCMWFGNTISHDHRSLMVCDKLSNLTIHVQCTSKPIIYTDIKVHTVKCGKMYKGTATGTCGQVT